MTPLVDQEPTQRTDLADLVRERRAELGLSYERLGERCVDPETGTRVPHSWLHRLETGRPVTIPQLPQLRAMAAGLALPLGQIQDAVGAQFLGLETVNPSATVRLLMRHVEGLTEDDVATLLEIAEALNWRRKSRPDQPRPEGP